MELVARSWQRVPQTANWVLPDESGVSLRHIAVRGPRIGEPNGTKYVVSGDVHGESIHSSLDEAKDAAEASLPS
jgi:hypothetical protein